MTLSAEIQRHSECGDVPRVDRIRRWANAAFSAASEGDAQVTIRIVDEAEGGELNRRYRAGDGATNVLSFAYPPSPFAQPDLLGDIVICAPVVAREAASQHKSAEAHWAHMVVHGILHLCGFDHEDTEQANRMERLESEILAGLGFPEPYE